MITFKAVSHVVAKRVTVLLQESFSIISDLTSIVTDSK